MSNVLPTRPAVLSSAILRIAGHGGVAQLGEHLPCKQGVRGSNPLISTNQMKVAEKLLPDGYGLLSVIRIFDTITAKMSYRQNLTVLSGATLRVAGICTLKTSYKLRDY